jgi:hypothetical protein
MLQRQYICNISATNLPRSHRLGPYFKLVRSLQQIIKAFNSLYEKRRVNGFKVFSSRALMIVSFCVRNFTRSFNYGLAKFTPQPLSSLSEKLLNPEFVS